MENESGLSRTIIFALVLAVVIIVVAAIIILFVFPPAPATIPSFQANIERSGSVVYLYHDGGDALPKAKTVFRINGGEVPSDTITFLHGQDWPWTTGETVRIQAAALTPELVEILYLDETAPVVLFSTRFTGTPVPTPVSDTPIVPITPSATVTVATPGETPGIPEAQPPIARYSAEPIDGPAPLMVRFTDTSGGSPESWLWSFGDGESSTSQHPVHVYQEPGVYPVSLTVRNPYGTNTLSEEGAIAVGMTPAAGFSAAPREGTAPLSVRFTDLSRGSPDQWSWNFGDGSGASEKDPAHMYLEPGDYSVSLTVSSQFGSNTRIQSNYIRITAPRMTEVSLFGSRTGSLLPGGYLQFVVTGTGGPIKIAGSEYPIRTGDLVQLFPDNVNTGEIDVNERGLTRFSFSNVRLFVNGELRRTGTVSDVTIAGISGVQSTFTISVPEGDADTLLFADGAKIHNRELAAITITGLIPDRAGSMYLSQKTGDLTYRGGASGLSVGEQ
ncbi:hypothetical protein ASZ90_016740 [hydrocarbon metagenome]|uniref:PKD domain-containing protein n=1 Tax=hydrocarbon metagenome TaxID=938273 RepID=A0A0W8EF00_9ZZZZ